MITARKTKEIRDCWATKSPLFFGHMIIAATPQEMVWLNHLLIKEGYSATPNQ
jgi:hypothetical protein